MGIFKNIILNGRPAGGKSELIDFMKKTASQKRRDSFHIGDFIELDDFVWLWDKFVEDDLWEALGEKRIYSRIVEDGYVQTEGDQLLDMLITKFNTVVARDYAGTPDFYDDHTLIIEFARGGADGGYRKAYQLLAKELLEDAVLVYINVPYEESIRRNEARYQEALAHSILAHKVPDEGMVRFSKDQDWAELTGGRESGTIELHGIEVPFVTINNVPELTEYDALAERYAPAFQTLWELYEKRS